MTRMPSRPIDHDTGSMRKTVLATAVMVLLSMALAVALFEAVVDQRLRIRSGLSTDVVAAERRDAPPPTFIAQSLERDYTLVDLATGQVGPSGKITETFDQFGMRASTTHSSFPHAKTVALVGDSFTAGAEVPFEETLQARLASRFPSVNLMNFGISGSNSRFYPAQAQRFIERTGIRPDVYVVGLYKDMQVGDVPRREAAERHGGRVSYRGVQVSRAEYERLRDSWTRRAAFEAEIFLREHSSTFNVLFPPKPSQDFAVPLIGELSPERFAKWKADLLGTMRELARTSPGSRVIVWLIPSNQDLIQKIAAQRSRKPRPVPPWLARSDQFWAELASELRAAGIDVIDPTQAIEALFTGPRGEFPFTASGHFRPVAYEAAAELIAPCLALRLSEPAEDARPQRAACI